MKSIGMLFLFLCAVLIMAPSLSAQPMINASIHVSVIGDSSLGRKTLDPTSGDALVVQGQSNSGVNMMLLKCPGCSLIPQGCPCDTLLHVNFSVVTAHFLAKAEVQDSTYRATHGKKGKHTLLAYYIDPGTFSGKVKDYTNKKKATRILIDKDHTSYDIKIKVPPLTPVGSVGGGH